MKCDSAESRKLEDHSTQLSECIYFKYLNFRRPSQSSVSLLIHVQGRVTYHVAQNLLLTSKQKLRFGLACPGLARPKQNFCFEVNGSLHNLTCHPVYTTKSTRTEGTTFCRRYHWSPLTTTLLKEFAVIAC